MTILYEWKGYHSAHYENEQSLPRNAEHVSKMHSYFWAMVGAKPLHPHEKAFVDRICHFSCPILSDPPNPVDKRSPPVGNLGDTSNPCFVAPIMHCGPILFYSGWQQCGASGSSHLKSNRILSNVYR